MATWPRVLHRVSQQKRQTWSAPLAPLVNVDRLSTSPNRLSFAEALSAFERLVMDRKFMPGPVDYDVAIRCLSLGGLFRLQRKVGLASCLS